MREVRCILMALVALAASASPMKAQGSVYVPLDDPAYVYIDALQSRGYLRTLPLLERPHGECDRACHCSGLFAVDRVASEAGRESRVAPAAG
jgi:hypothetical protein